MLEKSGLSQWFTWAIKCDTYEYDQTDQTCHNDLPEQALSKSMQPLHVYRNQTCFNARSCEFAIDAIRCAMLQAKLLVIEVHCIVLKSDVIQKWIRQILQTDHVLQSLYGPVWVRIVAAAFLGSYHHSRGVPTCFRQSYGSEWLLAFAAGLYRSRIRMATDPCCKVIRVTGQNGHRPVLRDYTGHESEWPLTFVARFSGSLYPFLFLQQHPPEQKWPEVEPAVRKYSTCSWWESSAVSSWRQILTFKKS